MPREHCACPNAARRAAMMNDYKAVMAKIEDQLPGVLAQGGSATLLLDRDAPFARIDAIADGSVAFYAVRAAILGRRMLCSALTRQAIGAAPRRPGRPLWNRHAHKLWHARLAQGASRARKEQEHPRPQRHRPTPRRYHRPLPAGPRHSRCPGVRTLCILLQCTGPP